MRAACLDGSKGFVGILGRSRAVPFVRKDAGDALAYVGFIVDDQNIARHYDQTHTLNCVATTPQVRRAGVSPSASVR